MNLENKRLALAYDIKTGKNPFESFKTHFSGVKGSYCGGKFNVENTMVIYRVVEWDSPPLEIQKTSYNPNPENKPGRCHLYPDKVFYGSNRIDSAIMEALIKNADDYRYRYNDKCAGKRFVIGKWHLKIYGLTNVNFNYDPEIKADDPILTPTQKAIHEAFEKSLAPLTKVQKSEIKEVVKMYRSWFLSDNYGMTGALSKSLMYSEKEERINLIFYPSAIKPMVANNTALSKEIADNGEIFQPAEFNFCELSELTSEQISKGMIGYNLISTGLPDEKEIKWLYDRDSLTRYEIRDSTEKVGRNGKIIIMSKK